MWELVPSLVNAGIGLWETIKGNEGLDQLNKTPYPKYDVSPELKGAYDRAQQMSKQGYSPEEQASFQQNVARDLNTQSQRAMDASGGQLSRAIAAMGNIKAGEAQNKFAASDALLHRQNIKYADVLGQAIQRQKNLQTQADLHHRLLLEQAYGAEKKSGLNNIGSALNFGALMMSGKGGQKQKSDLTNPYSLSGTLNQGGLNSAMGGAQNSQYDWNFSGQPSFSAPQDLTGLDATEGGND